jgi:hypothetical protein
VFEILTVVASTLEEGMGPATVELEMFPRIEELPALAVEEGKGVVTLELRVLPSAKELSVPAIEEGVDP